MAAVTSTDSIEDIARRIASEAGGFTGGPIERFGDVGRHTLKSLKFTGLKRDSYVLDVGCGVLRLGYWLIRYLQPDRYCGIEPNPKYVEIGLKHAIGPELAAAKRPRFDGNTDFDFSRFGIKFDFVVARSIFSHASPEMVCRTLESFRDNSSADGVMLVSYKPLSKDNIGARVIDLKQKSGDWSWRRYGKAHLQRLARERDLFAANFGKPFNGQVWLRVSKRDLKKSRKAVEAMELPV
jgi:SAM-dependent methyltransferase